MFLPLPHSAIELVPEPIANAKPSAANKSVEDGESSSSLLAAVSVRSDKDEGKEACADDGRAVKADGIADGGCFIVINSFDFRPPLFGTCFGIKGKCRSRARYLNIVNLKIKNRKSVMQREERRKKKEERRKKKEERRKKVR